MWTLCRQSVAGMLTRFPDLDTGEQIYTCPPEDATTIQFPPTAALLYFDLYGNPQDTVWYGDMVSLPAVAYANFIGVEFEDTGVIAGNCYLTDSSHMLRALRNAGVAYVVAGDGALHTALKDVPAMLCPWIARYIQAGDPPEDAIKYAKSQLWLWLKRWGEQYTPYFKALSAYKVWRFHTTN